MPPADLISVGIDTTSGQKLTYACLDRDLKPIALAEGETGEIVSFVLAHNSAFVAINSPSQISTGVVRRQLQTRNPSAKVLRGAGIRLAERELRDRGVAVSPTPSNIALCPPWVQIGFGLYRELGSHGFRTFPDSDASYQVLETHPHAAFAALLGSLPLPKPTLEGRLQRALVLFERGVRIRDPMSFLEEITRHRLLHGVLPVDLLPSPQILDALVAAYTAWVAANKPSEICTVGDAAEGMITLPAPELPPHY